MSWKSKPRFIWFPYDRVEHQMCIRNFIFNYLFYLLDFKNFNRKFIPILSSLLWPYWKPFASKSVFLIFYHTWLYYSSIYFNFISSDLFRNGLKSFLKSYEVYAFLNLFWFWSFALDLSFKSNIQLSEMILFWWILSYLKKT